jgi:hypothetical protein
MKSIVLASTVAIAFCVAAPAAQQQATPATAPPAQDVVMLTGCVTAGVTADKEPKPMFNLTDPSANSQQARSRTARPGTADTSGQPTSIELRPVADANTQGLDAEALKAYAGQRVEVIVRKVEPLPAAETAGPATAQTAKPTEPAPEPFSVLEIKPVAGACPK